MQNTPEYPAKLTIDYPDRELNRVTSIFRIFVALPILIILISLVGFNNSGDRGETGAKIVLAGSSFVVLPLILMILFRQKYPRWWFDWNFNLTKFSNRVGAYIALMRDEYPSTDEEQAVHVELTYPDAKTLNRWLPLVKWFLAIPHYFILIFLAIAVFFCVFPVAWLCILFTGKYPRGLFDFILGFARWCLRVEAYSMLLLTDKYPPFSLS